MSLHDLPVHLTTRFFYPFLFPSQRQAALVGKLTHASPAGRAAWQVVDDLPDDYLDNTLPYLRPTLFRAAEPRSGCYLTASEHVRRVLGEFTVHVPEHDDRISARLDPRCGIELFVTSYGVAVFSLAVEALAELTWRQARDFNACLHYGPSWDAEKRRATIQFAPAGDAAGGDPFPGDAPTLAELMQWLLEPLGAFDEPGDTCQTLQRSFGVFSVIRCRDAVDFADDAWREPLAGEFSGLQGIWRSSHAGAGRALPRYQAVLNRRHWLAVGNQSAVHVVADQAEAEGDAAVEFNAERTRHALTKHFFQYLLAIVQRFTLQSFAAQAEAAIRLGGPAAPNPERVAVVRAGLLDFSLRAQPFQLSNEDLSARVYRLCVEALGVPELWRHLRRVLGELDASWTVRQQTGSLSVIAAIQNKVEWVEAFVVSVYAVELSHVVGEGLGLDHAHAKLPTWYPGVSLIVVAGGTLALAIWALELLRPHAPEMAGGAEPDERTRHRRGLNRKLLALSLGCLLFLAHLLVGWWVAKPLSKDAGADGHAARSSRASSVSVEQIFQSNGSRFH